MPTWVGVPNSKFTLLVSALGGKLPFRHPSILGAYVGDVLPFRILLREQNCNRASARTAPRRWGRVAMPAFLQNKATQDPVGRERLELSRPFGPKGFKSFVYTIPPPTHLRTLLPYGKIATERSEDSTHPFCLYLYFSRRSQN